MNGTQQAGFATVDVTNLNVSAAAYGLHKGLNCTTGLAALYVSPSAIEEANPSLPIVGSGAVSNVRGDLLVPADPIMYYPNARIFEHLNVNLISCAAARTWLELYLDVTGAENVEGHLDSLADALRNACKALGIKIVGPDSREYHALYLYILDLHEPNWMEHLKTHNIHVTVYRLGIRFFFGYCNNMGDVETLTTILQSGIDAGFPLE